MTISEMKSIAKAKGSYYFSPSTMEFFGSRVETEPNVFCDFVTSEADKLGYVWNGDRRYSTHHFDAETGEVTDISEFGEYATLEEAKGALA